MPYIKVYIHFVWSTKNRKHYFDSSETRQRVWTHIRDNARAKDIFVEFIGGYADHCHCLISFGVDQTIQKVMQLIKGESSFWINKESITNDHFEWQNDYFAVSVSESMIDKVKAYIANQEAHHKIKTFQEEYEEFILKFGFQRIKDI